MVPNIGTRVRNGEDHINGLTLNTLPKKGQSKMREQSFQVRGSDIYNCLPEDLRSLDVNMDTYKEKLDAFLSLLLDKPRIGEGSKSQSNNLMKSLSSLTGEVIAKVSYVSVSTALCFVFY